MSRGRLIAMGALIVPAAAGCIAAAIAIFQDRDAERHFAGSETRVVVTAPGLAKVRLFRAGNGISEASEMPWSPGPQTWLMKGNYFFQVEEAGRALLYPAPVLGFRSGPNPDGTLAITVRPEPANSPAGFVHIPSGPFLMGDRGNPQEPHYVWVSAFFISRFEVDNAAFRKFLEDSNGFANRSAASARLSSSGADFRRFGQPDQPVTSVTWFEAKAYCRWLTKTAGNGTWRFSLPNDAEWEKAARGPDNFDYGLSMQISDAEVPLYNWKKNPGVPVTVVGAAETESAYRPNRYGIYHMSGNVAEWTQSVFRSYNRQHPFVDDERNRDDSAERRTVRGGSWYSATTAPIYLPYRDAFQPDHASNDVGFRVIARPLP